jgi:hypothetical protein
MKRPNFDIAKDDIDATSETVSSHLLEDILHYAAARNYSVGPFVQIENGGNHNACIVLYYQTQPEEWQAVITSEPVEPGGLAFKIYEKNPPQDEKE